MGATKYFTGSETTKLLKAELKSRWPNTKFSVYRPASRRSIRVEYENGPSSRSVTEIANKYEGASFASQIDLESDIDQTRIIDGVPTKVHYQVSYVFVSQHLTDEAQDVIRAKFKERFGFDFDGFYDLDPIWSRPFREIEHTTSFFDGLSDKATYQAGRGYENHE